MNKEKLTFEECIESLASLKPQAGDTLEAGAIVLMDINDLYGCKSKKDFRKEKRDCLRTMRSLYWQVFKMKFCKDCVKH